MKEKTSIRKILGLIHNDDGFIIEGPETRKKSILKYFSKIIVFFYVISFSFYVILCLFSLVNKHKFSVVQQEKIIPIILLMFILLGVIILLIFWLSNNNYKKVQK